MTECWNCGEATDNGPRLIVFISEGKVYDEAFGVLCDVCQSKIDKMNARIKRKKLGNYTKSIVERP